MNLKAVSNLLSEGHTKSDIYNELSKGKPSKRIAHWIASHPSSTQFHKSMRLLKYYSIMFISYLVIIGFFFIFNFYKLNSFIGVLLVISAVLLLGTVFTQMIRLGTIDFLLVSTVIPALITFEFSLIFFAIDLKTSQNSLGYYYPVITIIILAALFFSFKIFGTNFLYRYKWDDRQQIPIFFE